jgi:hypothetical protein
MKEMVLLAHRVSDRKDFYEQFGVKQGLNFVQIKWHSQNKQYKKNLQAGFTNSHMLLQNTV